MSMKQCASFVSVLFQFYFTCKCRIRETYKLQFDDVCYCDQFTKCLYAHKSMPAQLPTLCGMGNKYRPKCSDALLLRNKCRMAHSIDG